MMEKLDLAAPTHLTEALRANMSGGKSVAQLLAEAAPRRHSCRLPNCGGGSATTAAIW